MKKQKLLEYFDDSLLDKLFGFCYARTNDSYEAKELCSDIIFALVKAARSEGEIANPYSFIWKVARNVYADYSKNRRRQQETLYDGDMLYTKILACSMADAGRLFDITYGLYNGVFKKDAEAVAEKMAALIKKSVPEYLLGEWRFANVIAGMPVLDAVVEGLIEKGILTPPENGIGAEGCWMSFKK